MVTWRLQIDEMEYADVRGDDRALLARWVAWLEKMGYTCTVYGMNPATGEGWRIAAYISRFKADTERGDSIAFDGRYEVAPVHPHRWPEDVPE